MLMIIADTPEHVRTEVVKYITWRMDSQRTNEVQATTQRDRIKHGYAKAVLENILKDLTEVVIAPRE